MLLFRLMREHERLPDADAFRHAAAIIFTLSARMPYEPCAHTPLPPPCCAIL